MLIQLMNFFLSQSFALTISTKNLNFFECFFIAYCAEVSALCFTFSILLQIIAVSKLKMAETWMIYDEEKYQLFSESHSRLTWNNNERNDKSKLHTSIKMKIEPLVYKYLIYDMIYNT